MPEFRRISTAPTFRQGQGPDQSVSDRNSKGSVKTRQPYTYTILRYVHDIRTGEFLNVGDVLHVPATSEVLFQTRTIFGRVKSAFPDLAGEAFLHAMSAVRRALSAVTNDAEPIYIEIWRSIRYNTVSFFRDIPPNPRWDHIS